MKLKTRKVLRSLGIGIFVTTVTLGCLTVAAISFLKQAASRIDDAPAKAIRDAMMNTLHEGTPERKLELIATLDSASPAAAAPYLPMLREVAKDPNPEVSQAARKTLSRVAPPGWMDDDSPIRPLGIVASKQMTNEARIALWLGGTAWRVRRDHEDQIVHIIQDQESGALSLSGHYLPASFLPHYRRTLLGQPWPGDYPCNCRFTSEPGKRALISAVDSGSLNMQFNRIGVAYRKASEHQGSVKNLAASNAWDEKRLRDLDAQTKGLSYQEQVLTGAEGVRKSFRETIAVNQKSLEEHERLYRIYHAAAVSPTLLTDPEIVEP